MCFFEFSVLNIAAIYASVVVSVYWVPVITVINYDKVGGLKDNRNVCLPILKARSLKWCLPPEAPEKHPLLASSSCRCRSTLTFPSMTTIPFSSLCM